MRAYSTGTVSRQIVFYHARTTVWCQKETKYVLYCASHPPLINIFLNYMLKKGYLGLAHNTE